MTFLDQYGGDYVIHGFWADGVIEGCSTHISGGKQADVIYQSGKVAWKVEDHDTSGEDGGEEISEENVDEEDDAESDPNY